MPRTRRRVPSTTAAGNIRSPPRRALAFARLRTAHDSTIRELVHDSWDEVPNFLPPRCATDITGAAIQAAQFEDESNLQPSTLSLNQFHSNFHFHNEPRSQQYLPTVSRFKDHPHSSTRDITLRSKELPFRIESATDSDPDDSIQLSTQHDGKLNLSIDDDDDSIAIPRSVRVGERIQRSVIRPVSLGDNWSFDLVAVWHNAIRLELADLEDIIAGLSVNACMGVSVSELRAFFAWFSTFEAFVVTCLKAEEEVLYPWIEQWGRIGGELSTSARITRKGLIFRGIRDTAACAALARLDQGLPAGMVLTNPQRRYYDSLNVGSAESLSGKPRNIPSTAFRSAIVQKISANIANFSVALLDYFHLQEKMLPKVLNRLYDVRDRNAAAIERRIVKLIWKCGRKEDSMVIIAKAVEYAPHSKAWLSRNFTYLERLTLPLWKRKYDSGRGAVTAKFKVRNQSWENRIPPTMAEPQSFVFERVSGDDHHSLLTSTASSSANSAYPSTLGSGQSPLTIPSSPVTEATPPLQPSVSKLLSPKKMTSRRKNSHQRFSVDEQTTMKKSSAELKSSQRISSLEKSPVQLQSPLTSKIFSLNTTLSSLQSTPSEQENGRVC